MLLLLLLLLLSFMLLFLFSLLKRGWRLGPTHAQDFATKMLERK